MGEDLGCLHLICFGNWTDPEIVENCIFHCSVGDRFRETEAVLNSCPVNCCGLSGLSAPSLKTPCKRPKNRSQHRYSQTPDEVPGN